MPTLIYLQNLIHWNQTVENYILTGRYIIQMIETSEPKWKVPPGFLRKTLNEIIKLIPRWHINGTVSPGFVKKLGYNPEGGFLVQIHLQKRRKNYNIKTLDYWIQSNLNM